jgi:UDP-Gal:alpha-D-GlcNAc-diphosphoundecaprenol beta-1,4-galactosyltransferase
MVGNFVKKDLEAKICSYSNFAEILEKKENETRVISFLNPFSYPIVANDPYIISEVDDWFVDGAALCWLTNLKRKEKILRASFDLTSVGKDFLEFAERKKLRVAIIGSNEYENDTACNNLCSLFSDLNIVFKHHGFFNKSNFKDIYSKINSSGANYLVVGMGTPMQELFAICCKKYCPNLILILTCGGFLTQTAMKSDYYHPLIKKLGLRWFQRAFLHQHVRERLIKHYPIFIFRYLMNK